MGNVITVRFQEGDYGNPFVLNYMPKWGNGRPSRLKICRLQRRASSTLALGTEKDKINFDNSKKNCYLCIESSLIFVVLYLESFWPGLNPHCRKGN